MTMKNGFSTINRLLGKHKESSSNLSRSSTNLSVTKSNVNICDSSQVHQNRITPLPIATSNAPFEQTFRITVLLPRDQLYVARLGAKVMLHKLLQLVCENKQLDPDKYEFQHPADPSQIFSCDLTIGAVGLSEIRLSSKSEYSSSVRGDDVTSRRNSLSSSKFSRNSKNISNTPSLYSSMNSLNSMSSSGIEANSRNVTPEAVTPKHLAPVIPMRKKRPAPRPPSQSSSIENDTTLRAKPSESPANTPDSQQPIANQTAEQRIFETNELNKSNLAIDCNDNTKGSLLSNGHCITQFQETNSSEVVRTNDEVLFDKNLNLDCSTETTSTKIQPEPSPRRKVQTSPKKSVPLAPIRLSKSPAEEMFEPEPTEIERRDLKVLDEVNVSFSRPASTNTLIFEPIKEQAGSFENISENFCNHTSIAEPNSNLQTRDGRSSPVGKLSISSMSKSFGLVDGGEHIDRSSTPSSVETKHKSFIESSSEDDEMIKVYDLKLGKTIVKTLSNHKTSEVIDGILSINEAEQTSETKSSNKEDKVPSLSEESPLKKEDAPQDLSVVSMKKEDKIPETNSSKLKEDQVVKSSVNSESCVTSSKDEVSVYSIIEDNQKQEKLWIINEIKTQEVLIEKLELNQSVTENIAAQVAEPIAEPVEEPVTKHQTEPVAEPVIEPVAKPVEEPVAKHPAEPVIELIVEPVAEPITVKIIQEQNKNAKDNAKDSGNPTDTSLFNQTKQIASSSEIKENSDEKEQEPKVKNNITTQDNDKQEPLISTLERLLDEDLLDEENLKASVKETKPPIQAKPSLATRSSSFLSHAQLESNNQRNYTTGENFNRRRRSSSELSIGESPSLQSLGVIKSILNSRKNSLCGSEESNRSPPTECDIQLMEEPSPKSNNILKTNKINKTIEEKVYRYSGPPNIHFSTWSERPKIQVLIKNEQDCVVDGSKTNGQQTTSSVNRGDVALKKTNTNFNSGTENLVKRRIEKETFKETNSTYFSEKQINKPVNSSPSSTTPKFILGGRTSNAWPVGPTISSSTSVHNNRPLSQPVLRSTSITRINQSPVIKETQPAFAFGQNTLRKTGLKERIVPSQDTDTDSDVSKPIPFTLKNQTNPQTTPKITNTIVRTVRPVSNVPEAPPPPIIRAVVTKQKSNNRSQISLAVDPRDQLLSAIRSFKKEELKNANI